MLLVPLGTASVVPSVNPGCGIDPPQRGPLGHERGAAGSEPACVKETFLASAANEPFQTDSGELQSRPAFV